MSFLLNHVQQTGTQPGYPTKSCSMDMLPSRYHEVVRLMVRATGQ